MIVTPGAPATPEPRAAVRTLAGVLAFALAVVPAGSQELVTDRPDQTESSSTVPTGLWQLETGVLYEEGPEQEAVSAPGTLLRIGLHDRVELRVGWDGWTATTRDGPEGAGDGELGTKITLRPEPAAGPEIALLLGTSIPWGDDDVTSERFDPGARLAVTHALGEGVSLGWNLGASWETEIEGGDRSTSSRALATAAVGFALAEDVGVFVELFGTAPLSGTGDDELSVDAGATWLPAPAFQLDVAVGVALSGPAPDRFAGVGLTYRWPR